MIVNVIISTYDRIDLIKKTIDSLRGSNYPEIKTWICVDGNSNMIRLITEYCPERDIKILHNKRRKEIMFSYRKLLSVIDNDGAILNGADDIAFYPGTIKTAVKKLFRKFPDGDGVVGFCQIINDRPGGRKYAHCLIGRKFAERFPGRQMFCPDYIHFNGDRELGIYAQSIRRFLFLPMAKIIHVRTPDRTTGLSKSVYARDKLVFRKRQERNLLWGSSFKLIAKELKI